MSSDQIITFTRGVPCPEAFDTQKMENSARAILEADGSTILQYGASAGYLPIRRMLADWYGSSPEELLVSNGSLQILEFISTLLLSPVDTVFVEAPTYDRTIALFRPHQVSLVGVPWSAMASTRSF